MRLIISHRLAHATSSGALRHLLHCVEKGRDFGIQQVVPSPLEKVPKGRMRSLAAPLRHHHMNAVQHRADVLEYLDVVDAMNAEALCFQK